VTFFAETFLAGRGGASDDRRTGFAAAEISAGAAAAFLDGAFRGTGFARATEAGETGLGGVFTGAELGTAGAPLAMVLRTGSDPLLVPMRRPAISPPMSVAGKKLGLLLSGDPDGPSFTHGVKFAEAALAAGCDVYLYCIDEAVRGVRRADLQALRPSGLKLYACAYGAHRHGIPIDDSAAFAGLTVVSDLVAGTGRFVSFN